MGSKRDMTNANWKRTLKRLRRNAQELAAHDWAIREPDNVETPPRERNGRGSEVSHT